MLKHFVRSHALNIVSRVHMHSVNYGRMFALGPDYWPYPIPSDDIEYWPRRYRRSWFPYPPYPYPYFPYPVPLSEPIYI